MLPLLPRIDQRCAGVFEMLHVACGYREPVSRCDRGDVGKTERGRQDTAAIDRLPRTLADLPIIVGLAPIRSCDHARRLGAIPGIVVPDRLLALLDRASDEADACERYWAYLDAELDWLTRNVPHRGFHLMPIGHSKRGIRQSSSFDRLYAAVTRALDAAPPKPADVAAPVDVSVFGTSAG